MLDIIICEDNEKQREQIQAILTNAVDSYSLDTEIVLATDDPYKVVNYIEKGKNNTGIYFLDISLQSNINGLDLGKKIRSSDPDGYIIFITSHSEMTPLTFQYKVEAMDYIIKDDIAVIKDRVTECLLQACQSYESNRMKKNRYIPINSGARTINIKLDDILFFETSDKVHKVKVHTFTGQIEFYGTLKEVEDLLDNNFYRSHKSYLVNIKNIKEIDKQNMVAIMANGQKCYISGRYLKGILKK